MFHGRRIGCKYLVRVMAATIQVPDLFIRHRRDHLQQFRIFTKEVLADVCTVLGLVGLVFTVDHFFHALQQQTLRVFRKQGIPMRAPDDLDDIPAGTPEHTFEFLDDLAVAAYRSVQTLQIAVDDEHEVIELLTRGHTDGTE